MGENEFENPRQILIKWWVTEEMRFIHFFMCHNSVGELGAKDVVLMVDATRFPHSNQPEVISCNTFWFGRRRSKRIVHREM